MMEAIVQHQHHQPSPAAGFLLPILDGATPTPPAPTTSSPPSWSSGSSYTSNSSSSSTATASSGQGHYTWVPRSGPDYFGRHHSSSGSGTIVSPIVSSFISSPRRPSPPTRPSASGARLNRSAAKSASKSPSSSSTSTSTIMSTAASTTRAANKRSSDDDGSSGASSNTKVKLPRLDRGPEDFSTVVKNRLQSYTRTGQACDRCKVRKIRCDALPEGCSHCINQNLECYVTNRVTGRTERRGYLQELEREKNDMIACIRDLEKLLEDSGVQVMPWQGNYPNYPPGVSFDSMGNPVQDPTTESPWSQSGCVWFKNDGASPKQRFSPSFPRSLLESRPEDSHLGVGTDSAPLSSIKGTRLSILGTTIDLASFDAPDVDDPPEDAQISTPLYNKSPQAFLQSAMHINPAMHVDLPSRQDAFTYSEWYFLTVSNFLPILHKPTFMRLLTRMYDEPNFEPSVAQLVSVHMVFAVMYFQYSVRNREQVEHFNNLNDLSNKHYHFSLSKLFDLTSSRTLESVQAMALICAHTRSFPKPGCGSIIANLALQRALELNLHRESRKPEEPTNLTHELRKRAWWAILTAHVAVTGRRGRPMPIAVEDFDVGFPSPIADELLSDEGVDTSRNIPCPYEVGIAGFKVIPIFMEMYSNIYSVRRDVKNYANMVEALEGQINTWQRELPDYLRVPRPDQTDQVYMSALYTKMFALEYRLCLRHPSVAMTTDKKMMAENMRICEEAARELLLCLQEVQRLKSLDTTWYQMSVYAGAAFSMLAAHWERRFETTPEAISLLRGEMNSWVGILEEIGILLGSGPRITTEFSVIIDRTIATIERDMQSRRTPLPAVTSAIKQESQPQSSAFQVSQAPSAVPTANGQTDMSQKGFYPNPTVNGQTPYPPLAYDQAQNNLAPPPYEADAAIFYSDPAQAAAAAAAAAAASATTMPDASSAANPLIAFASQATQHVVPQPGDMMWQSRGNTWHDWTAAIADSQDRYGAGALLTLGAGTRDSIGAAEAAPIQTTGDMAVSQATQWPLMLFDHPVTGGTQ